MKGPAPTIDAIRAGDRAAIARLISGIERGDAAADALLASLKANTGRRHAGPAHRIGITGPPGAGKSSLTNQLLMALRASKATVAVLAVDPSSPFTKGALLGDRLRMNDIAGDAGVFIRSLAARGALGGLSAAVADSAVVLDAAGFDFIVIETVGVGQNEYDIVHVSDTTVVVMTPESGDEVQIAKAGLMEIADVFVLNKEDRAGSDRYHAAILAMLDLRQQSAPPERWRPPIVRTVAVEGKGIAQLVEVLAAHRRHREQNAP